jgi:predicted transcriptional regulator
MRSEFFGSPTAAQLTEAVREFLESLADDISQDRSFHLRVAINALRVVERELAISEEAEAGHRHRMAALGVDDDKDLARAIRAGQFPAARQDEILASVLADVEARLQANSPHYIERYEAGE